MKLKLHLAILVFSVSYIANSQVNVQWESRYTSSGNNTDQAVDMVIDAAGNVYVTGTSFTGSGTGYDIVTVKYDNTGAQQWTATYNGTASLLDQGNAIILDAAGNVFVTGYTYVSGTNADVVILKYDNNGNLVWTQTRNYQGYFDQGRDIAVDSNGDVYVTGSGQYNSTGSDVDYLTLKYNNAGTFQWQQTFSTDVSSPPSQLDEAFRIFIDGSNNVYVAGNSAGTTATNNLDFVTIKYNSAGTQQWRARYNYNGNFDTPTDISVDASGNVYVCGFGYYNALQDANYLLVKYNSTGTQQWVKNYNGDGSDYDKANALVLDPAGNIYITGRSIGASSAEDMYTIAYDPAGNVIWSDRFTSSGSAYEEANDIVIDGSGFLYITGYGYKTTTNNDFLTVKYNLASGAIEWSTRFNGPAGNSDRAMAISIDPAENIYITGQSNGGGTGADYSTIKYCQLTTDAGADAGICVGTSASLNVTTTGTGPFTWSVVTGDPINIGVNFSCNPCQNPVASPVISTTYAVSSTNVNGCIDYDTVTVLVNPLPGPTIYTSNGAVICDGDSTYLYTDPGQTGYSWNTGSANDSILVTVAGTYTVTVIDALGCSNSTNQGVLVNSLPAVDAGADDDVCDGGAAQLNATGASSFIWDVDTELSSLIIANPTAAPTSSSWYYVTGTDGNGCENRDSVFITVNPLPAAPVIVRLDPNLVSSYSSGNQWYLDGSPIAGATGQTYAFTQNGNYQVEYTDANGCTSMSAVFPVTNVGVDEWNQFSFAVYPNPAIPGNEIKIQSEMVIAAIQLYTVEGKLLNERVYGNSKLVSFNLGDVSSGIYMLSICWYNGYKASTFIMVE